MDDTVLRVAATIYGEAGVLGPAGMYAVAYVMACRMEQAQRTILRGEIPDDYMGGWWQDLLGDYMGGWTWYKQAVRDGTLAGEMEAAEIAGGLPLRLAWMLVRVRLLPYWPWQIVSLETGLVMGPDPLLYCMSQQDVDKNNWRDGDVVVEGPPPYALHLYGEWPGR